MRITLSDAVALTDQTVEVSILKEQSTAKLKASELSAIRKWTRKDYEAEEIYTFPCLAIDTNPTRNGVIYSEESQKATVKSWVGIPFLFNANAEGGMLSGGDHALVASSQVARIYKSQVVPTDKGNTGTLVWVYAIPGASPAIQEFCNKVDAGVLREVSIHVMARDVECSICGGEPGWEHEHQKGEKYGKEIAYIKTKGKLEPLELSSVACPGSTVAHIMDTSELSKYTSLREALSGSPTPIEAFMSDTDPKTESQVDPPVTTPASTETTETAPTSETPVVATEAIPAPAPAPIAKPLGLFEGTECPACGRADQAQTFSAESLTDEQRESILAPYRDDVKTKMEAVVTAANAKVTAAENALKEEREKHTDTNALLEMYVAETADLAVDKGIKTPAQRDAYVEELNTLGYRGVRAVRETIMSAHSAVDALREKSRQQLQIQTATSDAPRMSGRKRGNMAATIGRK